MNESKTITAATRDDCNVIAAALQDLANIEKVAAMSYINGIKDAHRISDATAKKETA